MNKILVSLLLVALFAPFSFAARSSGYVRHSTGTYVAPYSRSAPNYTVKDNYSYKGNINPSTGKTGSNYYKHSKSSDYYKGY